MTGSELTCKVTIEGGGPGVRTGRRTTVVASCTHALRVHAPTRAAARRDLTAAHGPKMYIPDVAVFLAPPGGEPLAESTIRSYRSQTRPIVGNPFPDPDGRDPRNGRPWWWEITIVRWRSQRPGAGYRSDVHQPAS